jgi:hypothetical protein
MFSLTGPIYTELDPYMPIFVNVHSSTYRRKLYVLATVNRLSGDACFNNFGRSGCPMREKFPMWVPVAFMLASLILCLVIQFNSV